MSYKDKQQDTLQLKDRVRTINLGAYFSVIAVSGLIFGSASPLGFLSAVLVSSFALALFYSIDNQLLNDALMPKLEHYTKTAISQAKQAVVCDIMEKQLSNLNVEEVIQPSCNTKPEQTVERFENVA